MPKMSYAEARRIIKHSTRWLLDTEGEHNKAVKAAVDMVKSVSVNVPESCAILGFAVGRAWGIREERERRRHR